jgi:hypothetical protein
MARRYEIDELLWLRSSPLVAKPPGLPPIEEWMYVLKFSSPRPLHIPTAKTDLITPLYRPQPDPTTQTKQRPSRDSNNPSETTTNRRPSFFEARHISRGSNSGRPCSWALCYPIIGQFVLLRLSLLTFLVKWYRRHHPWSAKNCLCVITNWWGR